MTVEASTFPSSFHRFPAELVGLRVDQEQREGALRDIAVGCDRQSVGSVGGGLFRVNHGVVGNGGDRLLLRPAVAVPEVGEGGLDGQDDQDDEEDSQEGRAWKRGT